MKRIILILACLSCTLHAQQVVTVLNNGSGGGTFNTPGVTTYYGGANTFNFVGSVVTGLPTNVGNTFTTLAVTGTTQLNGNVGIGGPFNAAYGLYEQTSFTFASGTTNVGLLVVPNFTFNANNEIATDTIYGSTGLQTVATGAFTGLEFDGLKIAAPALTGSGLGSAYMTRVNAGPAFTNLAGIAVASQTAATNNTDILYGTTTIPTGTNYGIYQGDSYANYFNGATSFGITVKAPGFQTVGTGSASTGSITGSSIEGLELFGGYSSGAGGTNDIALYNSSTVLVAAVPAGTTQFNVVGSISASNMPYSGGSATSGTYTATLPVIIGIKSVTILTAGTPANLATIVLPAGLTRYLIATSTSSITCYAETAAGTLAGGTIQLRTATAGGGSQMGSTITPPAALNGVTGTGGSDTAPWTNGTIYLYQTGSSANAGTVSIYITIKPII